MYIRFRELLRISNRKIGNENTYTDRSFKRLVSFFFGGGIFNRWLNLKTKSPLRFSSHCLCRGGGEVTVFFLQSLLVDQGWFSTDVRKTAQKKILAP